MATEAQKRIAPTLGRHQSFQVTDPPPLSAVEPAQEPRPSRSRRRRPISALTIRILLLNIPALGILLGGALFLGQYRQGLIDSRIDSLRKQGEIISGALGEAAVVGEIPGIDPEMSRQLISRLTSPIATRARLFIASGEMVADSRNFGPAAHEVEAQELPPPAERGGFGALFWDALDPILRASPRQPRLPLYREAFVQTASDYGEVLQAFGGESASAVRTLSNGDMIVSLGIPVQRFKQVVGVLLLSAPAAGIEEEVAAVRVAILQVFGIALAVTVLLSSYLASTIARPIRRLARAAEGAEYTTGRRSVIPDFTHRSDEIGELSASLRGMTDALYERLDAIEAFAADVAHEIKNPLSSIQSAIETLSRTQDEAQRERLVSIVTDDVQRLNRLITDISDASRLGAELARAERTPMDLLGVANTLAEIHRETGEGVPTVEVRSVGAGPFRVHCIADRIGQVLRNLLMNAASFSPPDSTVVVELRRFSGLVEISVADRGPGVPEDKLEEVFQRFYSLRPGCEPFGTHSGLGLSISRQIIEAHGGTIHVENRLGATGKVTGARFVVALPGI